MNKESIRKIKSYSIGELFKTGDTYRIPLYQRNFSWGDPEVKQLIRDIADFASKNEFDRHYYLGILVVYKKSINDEPQYEVVDGQQRLTVLTLLVQRLKSGIEFDGKSHSFDMDINSTLNFAHRPKAQSTFAAINAGDIKELGDDKTHDRIKSVYERIPRILREQVKESGCTINNFYKYLRESVYLYRSPLPDDTELNHYFEVMNNRGEQLEKHEILKAQMLNTINEEREISVNEKLKLRIALNDVWEACSNMNKYVQYGFEKKETRKFLFGKDWTNPLNDEWFKNEVFEELISCLNIKNKVTTNKKGSITYDKEGENIDQLLKRKPDTFKENDKADNSPDRFQSPINFQNFLLHVLRLYQNKTDDIVKNEQYASLDDKVLLNQFSKYTNKLEFVKVFTVLLLKARFLLDHFVIKRAYEGEKDKWSLMKLKNYSETTGTESYVNTFGDDGNKRLVMLLAMFHVSTPTQNYKHWLTAVLSYLINAKNINSEEYINHLELLARKLFYDRFMIKDDEEQCKYEEIVFNDSNTLKLLRNKNGVDRELLRYKEVKNNLVFNYLDYLIWLYKNKPSFDFKFRSSVEHFNPQNPNNHKRLDDKYLDSFGNLCLVAHGNNSSLRNNNPLAKSYSDTLKGPLDSLKLDLMMKKAQEEKDNQSEYGGWGPEQVENHEKAMIEKFESQFRLENY